jgi:ribonuclease HI
MFLINTQLRYPTIQNNHPDKIILQGITKHLTNQITLINTQKVKAHKNIIGNKEADKLAKEG